jgi:pantoate--beta-alanine ligase
VNVARSKTELTEALAEPRGAHKPIGLVPTMGALHDGHVSLLRAARERAGHVVMSLFVNPTQFGPSEDLQAYPRDEAGDFEIAEAAGVDTVFAPPVEEVYPPGFATSVVVDERLTGVLDGDPSRRGPAHFRGVTTVVTKLLNLVRPDFAFFGQKDAQQAIVLRRMALDLDLPAEIVVLPTVRESSGLALSSRNAYLSAPEREQATALARGLRAAEEAAARPDATLEAVLAAARAELTAAGIEPEYLEARDAEDLSEAASLNGRPLLLAVAARIGRARLIDNVVLDADEGTGTS